MSKPTEAMLKAARVRFPDGGPSNAHWKALQTGRQNDFAEGMAHAATLVEASLEDFAAGRADAIEELASEVECRSKAAYAKVRDFESGTMKRHTLQLGYS